MMNKLRSLRALTLGGIGSALGAAAAHAQGTAAVDFTAAAQQITTDNQKALQVGLPIFAVVFGIVVVKSFFKKTTH